MGFWNFASHFGGPFGSKEPNVKVLNKVSDKLIRGMDRGEGIIRSVGGGEIADALGSVVGGLKTGAKEVKDITGHLIGIGDYVDSRYNHETPIHEEVPPQPPLPTGNPFTVMLPQQPYLVHDVSVPQKTIIIDHQGPIGSARDRGSPVYATY